MEKQKNTQGIIIAVLAVTVLVMSVGFANFTQALNIVGNTTVSNASWNIAFDTTSYQEGTGSVTVASTDRSLNGTTMSYNVTLPAPGTFYEFSVNVKNTGTFDANLTAITMSGLTEEQAKYLTYEIYYNNSVTPYTATTTGLTIPISNTSGVVPVKVRISYIQPADSADLPSSNVTIPLTASLTYTQQ